MSDRSFAQGQFRPPGGPGKLMHTVSWMDGSILFEHRHWSGEEVEPGPSRRTHHRIVLTESGGTARTQVRLEGRAVYDGHDQPGTLTFIPALVERECRYRSADLVFSGIWVAPALQERLSGGDALLPDRAMVNGNDDVVSTLLASLSKEVVAGRTPGAAYVEHLAALMLLRLADPRPAASQSVGRGFLPRKALSYVQEYIEAHLGADISLADLAGLLALPIDTFARQFRATTGISPYAYVITRRVEQACSLLCETDLPISEIALVLGFSSQSHFTTTFRRTQGVTPQAYRAQWHPGS
ncbi:MAG: AraC family transcriptional regulator [Ktedonobacteraceae bacterium]